MNLTELRQSVDAAFNACRSSGQNPDRVRVGIPVYVYGTLGSHPMVDIAGVDVGFDWDTGKVFIWPEVKLRSIEQDEIAKIRKDVDAVGREYMDIVRNRREIEELKREIEFLKSKLREQDV